MISIEKLLHASIVVEDINRSITFYSDLLGLTLSAKRPALPYPGAWFEFGEQQLHLIEQPKSTLVERPKPVSHDNHIAFSINNMRDFIVCLESVNIEYTKSRSGRSAIFIRDPDGNGLEFIESQSH